MTRKAIFTVTLDQAPAQVVSVDWVTVSGSAAGGAGFPGDGSDFASATGTLIFNPGETQKTIEVIVRDGDEVTQEDFSVTLSNPVGCVITDATGVAVLPAAGPTKTLVVQDDFQGAGAIQSHTGELNATWAMLYSDVPAQVQILSNELRKPTYLEDQNNSGGESNFYLVGADFDSSVGGGVSIEFDLKRGTAASDWFVALYRSGDVYGNSDLLAQIESTAVRVRTASGGSFSASTPYALGVNETQSVQIVVAGLIVEVYMNGALVAAGDIDAPMVGKLGWAMWDTGGEEVSFSIDNLKIYELGN